MFCKDLFLTLFFSLFRSIIFPLLCLLLSAALFKLTIWPFGPPPHWSPLQWRPHKELCFDWSAGMSTGVFLSIQTNVRPPSSQWIPTKLTSSPTSFYSTSTSVSIPLQLFLGSPLTALFPFLNIFTEGQVLPMYQGLMVYLSFLLGPLSLLYEAFLQPLLTYASHGWFPFLSATNITKLEHFHQAASCAITGCLSCSLIPLLLSEASLPPLRVTLNHFILSSYQPALCLPTSLPISGLARLGVKPKLFRSSWRAFAATHLLMLPSASPRKAILACPPFLLEICLLSLWSPPFPLQVLTLILLFLTKMQLLLT